MGGWHKGRYPVISASVRIIMSPAGMTLPDQVLIWISTYLRCMLSTARADMEGNCTNSEEMVQILYYTLYPEINKLDDASDLRQLIRSNASSSSGHLTFPSWIYPSILIGNLLLVLPRTRMRSHYYLSIRICHLLLSKFTIWIGLILLLFYFWCHLLFFNFPYFAL